MSPFNTRATKNGDIVAWHHFLPVSVFRGIGNGTFVPLNTGCFLWPTPASIVQGDFDGDGKTDLAVGNGLGVTFLLGNGDGTFRAPVDYRVSESPQFVAVGDFNNDGKTDVAVSTSSSFNLYVTILINSCQSCADISLLPSTLPNATAGSPYNQTITAAGGTSPYQYAVSSGTLPVGLSLSSSGSLSGTPTTAGTSSFTVSVTDANHCTGTKDYALTINNPQPVITNINPTWAVAGSAAFTVNGNNFVSTSTVRWNGSSRTTTYVTTTQVTAAITAADIASAGTISVTVVSPSPGGGTSNAVTFTIAPAGTHLAEITSPVAGSTLTSTQVTFAWTSGTGVSQYWLYIGRTSGGNEIYNQDEASSQSATV